MVFELKIDDEIDDFGRYLRVRQGLSQKTINQHTRMTRKYLEWCEEIEPDMDRAYEFKEEMMDDNYSASHINNTMKAIEYYYDYHNKEFPYNKLKRRKKTPDRITESEVKDMLQACERYRDYAIIKTLATSGVRAKELCDLDVKDLDSENLTLHIRDGKGGKDSYARVSEDALEAIERYLETREDPEGPLFLSTRGKRLTRNGLLQIVRRLGDRANLERVTVHMFRHYFATSLIKNGADISVVKELMRHESIKSTQKYLHLGDNTLESEHKEYLDDI